MRAAVALALVSGTTGKEDWRLPAQDAMWMGVPDTTGRGEMDLLRLTWSPKGPTMAVVGGEDGAVRWSRALPGELGNATAGLPLPAGDLDGDGAGDFAVPVSGGHDPYALGTAHMRFAFLSGTDGHTLESGGDGQGGAKPRPGHGPTVPGATTPAPHGPTSPTGGAAPQDTPGLGTAWLLLAVAGAAAWAGRRRPAG